jgi:hypothetical protein
MATQGIVEKVKTRQSDAYVIDVDDRLLVRPAVTILKQNNKFQISNLTGYEIDVTIGSGLSLAPGQTETKRIAKQKWDDFDTAGAAGCFRYEVRVIDGSPAGRKAHGDSDPVIIVD